MKTKLSFLALVAALIILFSGCMKEDHRIRFHNLFKENLTGVSVGPASFGNVNSGALTDYVDITTGTHNVSGKVSTGRLEGTVTLSGKGTHRWTLRLNGGGTISIEED